MSVRSAQSITVEFITSRFDTGAATNADSTPTGTLVVNGVDNAASVTVTNIDTGRYKAAVTLPTLAVGDVVELSIAATVNSVAAKGIVWRESACDPFDVTDGVETGYTLRQALRIMFAALSGRLQGAGAYSGGVGTITCRDPANSKNRISASVDEKGNRNIVTLDAS